MIPLIILINKYTNLQNINFRKPLIPAKNTFKYNKNQFIKAIEVRLIDENGEQVGVVGIEDALQRARTAELDLVEVSPNAKPPVCKIMSWSKFQYDLSKKENKAKKTKLKEIRMKPLIGGKDLEHKLKRVREFIEDKDTVKITVQGMGRVRREHQQELMDKILQNIAEFAEVDQSPKSEGRHISVLIRPTK